MKLVVSKTCQIENLAEIYRNHLPMLEDGFFVEIGAYDGESFSNTSCLADIGWKGLYIEPVEEHMVKCKQRHSNNSVNFEQVAIGSASKEVNINLADGLSTIDDLTHLAHKKLFNFQKDIQETVRQERLETIFSKYNVLKNFDLLVVDVEGHEHEVFNSFDLTMYRPYMIIVELCDVHGGYNDYPVLQNNAKYVRNLILSHGYKEIFVDPINTIFIKIS